jgi:hypothetical protein
MNVNIAFWGAVISSQVWASSANSNADFAIAACWLAYAAIVMARSLWSKK